MSKSKSKTPRTALRIARETMRAIRVQWQATYHEIGYTHTMRSAEAYPREAYAKVAYELDPSIFPPRLQLTPELAAVFAEPKRGYRVHVVLFAQFESASIGEQWVTLNRVAIEPDGFVLAVNNRLSDIAKGERGKVFDYDEFGAMVRCAIDVFVWHNKKKKPTATRKVKNPGSIRGTHT